MRKNSLVTLLLTISLFTNGQATILAKKWTSLFDGKTLNGWKQVAGTATYAVEDGTIVGRTVVSSSDTIPNTLTDFEKQNGWKLLFDGVSSAGWKSATKDNFPDKGWTIKDGVIGVAEMGGHEHIVGGDIVTKDQFSAFDLTFDFKLAPGGNSGLKYFVTRSDGEKGSVIGLEYQILDDKLHPDAKAGRDGNRTQASLYDLIKADKQERFVHPPGQWNTGRIVVYPNNHVEHYLNGVKVLEYERGSPAFRELVAISKYKGFANFGEAPTGRIMLQDHGNEVSFRSIKIKEIK